MKRIFRECFFKTMKRVLTSPLASSWVSTSRATTLLDVETTTTTSHTECVTLVPPLTETPCSLSLQYSKSSTIIISEMVFMVNRRKRKRRDHHWSE